MLRDSPSKVQTSLIYFFILFLAFAPLSAEQKLYDDKPLYGEVKMMDWMTDLRADYYSQAGEDFILSHIFKDVQKGFYVDVGAHHPTAINVCYYFYKKGWFGVNIEPLSFYHALLEKERPLDTNLKTLVGDTHGQSTLYEVGEAVDDGATALSTGSKEQAEVLKQKGHTVKESVLQIVPLNDILERYAKETIHILKIDVEGCEKAVLDGLDLTKYRPVVIVIEYKSPKMKDAYKIWGHILKEARYTLALSDNLNFYYVRSESPDILQRFKEIQSLVFWQKFGILKNRFLGFFR